MPAWAIVLMVVGSLAYGVALFAFIFWFATARIAKRFPPAETAPDLPWEPCQRVVIGSSKLSGGILLAASDDRAWHARPARWARRLGARGFSVPWEAMSPETQNVRFRGRAYIRATLVDGGSFLAPASTFAGALSAEGSAGAERSGEV